MKSILKQVLAEIKPDNEKELKKQLNRFIKKLNTILKKLNVSAKAVLGGSAAKGTWLKDDYDCDIFVRFALKHKKENLSLILQEALEIFAAVTLVHGSRDYFTLDKDDIHYEIVPVLDIKKPEQAMNVTDFSPAHVTWINKKINQKSDLRNQIMLLKRFCKANNLYGAESYINGFSGHVIDIIVTNYRTFENTLKQSLKWKDKQVIDVEKYYKRKNPLLELNKSKTQGPLIVIDPIDKTRNAAAALNDELFDKFKETAKQFLKKPSKEFFNLKELNIPKLKDKGAVIIEIKPKSGKKDIIGCKLVKVFSFLKQQIEMNDFKIKDMNWQWDNKVIMYFITNNNLEKEKVHQGPIKDMEEHVKIFKKKYKNTFIKSNRIHAKIKRKHTKIENLIKELIKEKYIKEKVNKIGVL